MAAIKISKFLGEIPKLSRSDGGSASTDGHLLPDGAAQYASNCDFSTGVLVPLKAGTLLTETAAGNGPIRTMYWRDEDNARWVSNNTTTYENFYQSPVVGDIYKRVYTIVQQTGGTNRALFGFQWNDTQEGGLPTDSGIDQAVVGVPAPTVAPVLQAARWPIDSFPGMTTPTWRVRAWYEANGVRYQETVFGDLTTKGQSSAGSNGGSISYSQYAVQFTITAPALTTTNEVDDDGEPVNNLTPEEAVFAVELILVDPTTVDGEVKQNQTLRLQTSVNATAPAKSSALPGGTEIVLFRQTGTDIYDIRLNWGVVETRAYCFTVVNEWGEESSPSPATLISVTYLDYVKVICAMPAFRTQSAPLYYYQARKIGAPGLNIYRTFGSNAGYVKIAHGGALVGATNLYDRFNASTSSNGTAAGTTFTQGGSGWYSPYLGTSVYSIVYDDVHTPSNVGTALASMTWSVPPSYSATEGELGGLVQMPNGWFCMYRGNTLYMSEPYRPHAWPYSMTFPTNIKATCMGAQSLVVTTQDAVYVVNGSHPAAVTQQRLNVPAGGISQQGICNVNGSVAVLTNDGILMVNGSQATYDFSSALFTRRVWNTMYGTVLASMRLSYHDGFLLGTCATQAGFVVRTDESPLSFSRLSTTMHTTARRPLTDQLVFSSSTDTYGNKVYSFNTGTPMTAVWWSKEYVFPDVVGLGAFMIRCDGAVAVIFYADGQMYYATSVSSGSHRIPSSRGLGDGFSPQVLTTPGLTGRARRWSVRLESSSPIQEFMAARTHGELKDV